MKALSILILALASAGGTQAQADSFRPSDDPAAIQRGAVLFLDNCASCHSLKYLRYDQLHQDLGFTPAQVKTYQHPTQSSAGSPITAQLTPEITQKMFGMTPPDLSLITSAQSPDWVYRYMLGFYPDSSRPSGMNNHVVKDVAMPNVLAPLQQQVGDQAFAGKVGDLVSFLHYAADPKAAERRHIGIWVLVFLIIFLIPVYLLDKDARKHTAAQGRITSKR